MAENLTLEVYPQPTTEHFAPTSGVRIERFIGPKVSVMSKGTSTYLKEQSDIIQRFTPIGKIPLTLITAMSFWKVSLENAGCGTKFNTFLRCLVWLPLNDTITSSPITKPFKDQWVEHTILHFYFFKFFFIWCQSQRTIFILAFLSSAILTSKIDLKKKRNNFLL